MQFVPFVNFYVVLQSPEIKIRSEVQQAQRKQDVSGCVFAILLLPAVSINAAV